MVAAVERGEMDESQLPRDMLTLVAQGAETFETFELTCQSALACSAAGEDSLDLRDGEDASTN